MFKLYIIASLCDGCKKCEEIIPWLLSQPDQCIYVNKSRANADELREEADRVVACCPCDAARISEFTV